MPPDQITLVRDEAVCRAAARAYGAVASQPAADSRLSRSVFVVVVGDRYLVKDPVYPARAGEYTIVMIFDRAFGYIMGFTG